MFEEEIKIVLKKEKHTEIEDIIINLLQYMEKKQWIGACYATASVLYVSLTEMGLKPKLCIGEVTTDKPRLMNFDHGWIELDDKIVDLACYMTLMDGLPVSYPILFDKEIITNINRKEKYGIYIRGLDETAKFVYEQPLSKYMSLYPNEKNGLWDVVKDVTGNYINTRRIKEKYASTKWNYIVNK